MEYQHIEIAGVEAATCFVTKKLKAFYSAEEYQHIKIARVEAVTCFATNKLKAFHSAESEDTNARWSSREDYLNKANHIVDSSY